MNHAGCHYSRNRQIVVALTSLVLSALINIGLAENSFYNLPPRERTQIHVETDAEFYKRHPEMGKRPIHPTSAEHANLRREWMAIRDQRVRYRTEKTGDDLRKDKVIGGMSQDVDNMMQMIKSNPHLTPRLKGYMDELHQLNQRAVRGGLTQREWDQMQNRINALVPQIQKEVSAMMNSSKNSIGGESVLSLPATVLEQQPPGQITPSSAMSKSSRDLLQKQIEALDNKIALRRKQAQIYADEAKQQQAHQQEGLSNYNWAYGFGGAEITKGAADTFMEASSWFTKKQGGGLLNDLYKMTTSAIETGYAGYEGDSLRFAKKGSSTAKSAGKIHDQVVNSISVFPEGYNPNPYFPGYDAEPSQLKTKSPLTQGATAANAGFSAVSAYNNYENGQYGDATKDGLDVVANVADMRGNNAVGKVTSAIKGTVTIGQGVSDLRQNAREKEDFSNFSQNLINNARSRSQQYQADVEALQRERDQMQYDLDLLIQQSGGR